MKSSCLQLSMLFLLLLVFKLASITDATPVLVKYMYYALDCTAHGSEHQNQGCSNGPFNYFCNGHGVVESATQNEFCESACQCIPALRREDDAQIEHRTTEVPQGSGFATSTSTDLAPVIQSLVEIMSEKPADDGLAVSSTTLAPVHETLTKRHDYALTCGDWRDTTRSLYKHCSSSPWKYSCTSGGQLVARVESDFCTTYCKCQELSKTCLSRPFGMSPICAELTGVVTHNSTAVTENSTNLAPAEERRANIPEIPSSSTDLSPTSLHTRAEDLSHDYALICDDQASTGSLYTKFCTSLPRKYWCNSQGRVKSLNDDTLCDSFCGCHKLGESCYIHPYLVTPVCSDVETGEVTDMQTGVVVGRTDSNGTIHFDDNWTTLWTVKPAKRGESDVKPGGTLDMETSADIKNHRGDEKFSYDDN